MTRAHLAGFKSRIAAGLAVVLASTGLIAAEPETPATPAPRHVKLLAIGNSFAQNATRFLPKIV